MSMPESDDDDSMNDLLSGSISSTPTPGGPVVERTATCNVLLAEKPRARLRWKPTTIVECTNKKGRTTQSVPFLEDLSNWMDIRLAHQVQNKLPDPEPPLTPVPNKKTKRELAGDKRQQIVSRLLFEMQ